MNTSIEVSVEEITPEQAEYLLENHNPNNRNLREPYARQLAEKIRSGQWQPSASTIRIAPDGDLLDGQHRLRACVQAGIPIQSVVIRNAPVEAQAEMDQGSKRTGSDVLRLAGVEGDTATLGKALRLLTTWDLGLVASAGSSRIADMLGADFIRAHEAHPRVAELIPWGRLVNRETGYPVATVVVARTIQERIAPVDVVEQFWAPITGQAGAVEPDPRATLRRWMRTTERTGKNGRMAQSRGLYGIALAWNKWRDGETLKMIKVVRQQAKHDDAGNEISKPIYHTMPEFK